MIQPTLKRIAIPALMLGALAACTPVYTTPHGGHIRADSARSGDYVYRAPDGRVFPTRAARDAYLARIDARERKAYRQDIRRQRAAEREAAILRDERRLRRLERERQLAEQRRAEAERAERRARRDARRLERARQRERELAAARLDLERAERAAVEAERRARREARRTRQISRRQQRVDNLAPRPGLSPAVLRKVERYSAYRRPGETVPAFVTRIARAERMEHREGQTVDHWLREMDSDRRKGASER